MLLDTAHAVCSSDALSVYDLTHSLFISFHSAGLCSDQREAAADHVAHGQRRERKASGDQNTQWRRDHDDVEVGGCGVVVEVGVSTG